MRSSIEESHHLHVETRRQQGDGNFVLLVNEEVRLVVSFECKKDSVIDGYVEEHHKGRPRFPNDELNPLRLRSSSKPLYPKLRTRAGSSSR
ncbi:BZ3500_MvSof-1268-A1-R1_Chr9g10731 [Microbotryum saponariae]|uniref:BZ3500_MvSof-1268-A1-R1_Chr9g10731 protein n=1 Tax=Microbotryum saponariae TaxID=289078 RepID=A0A2X0L534_9BASI|nr:BZ3501_MvSof-1269-A2-R1_Chr9g10479 [Microbotryum saponariae]SDA00599.1 BZ3500_MvSof-1268-A1-R1_Chr9g10731 [Microbotryum saponariae]